MKRDEIKEAAVKYFLKKGYEGASLSEIAEEAGIKKASIYSHFKGKDDLFLEILREGKAEEIKQKSNFFDEVDASNPEAFLYAYLLHAKEMFQSNALLKFWLRVGFFPPVHLYDTIQEEVIEAESFQEKQIADLSKQWLQNGLVTSKNEQTFSLAFTGIIMAVMVEIVYFNDRKRVEDKLEALWYVFWQGVRS